MNDACEEMEMPIFDMISVTCLDQQEAFTDEVYLTATDSRGRVTRCEIGRDMENDETVNPDIYFAYEGTITLALWEDDPGGDRWDDKIGSWTVGPSDRGERLILNESGAEYLIRYDVLRG